MGAIADAIVELRATQCITAQWIADLDEDDRLELTRYAKEHPASSYNLVCEFGFGPSRSTWTAHFKGQCVCPKTEE